MKKTKEKENPNTNNVFYETIFYKLTLSIINSKILEMIKITNLSLKSLIGNDFSKIKSL